MGGGGMNEITLCEDCQHMHPDSRNGPSWRAMCSKFPRLEGMGFVTRNIWDRDPPYMYCHNINGGACCVFEKRKQPTEE